MKTTTTPTVKKKTKEQRCNALAQVVFCQAVVRIAEIAERMPKQPSKSDMRNMIINRFNLAVEAADVFESEWPRIRGRFLDKKGDEDEETD